MSAARKVVVRVLPGRVIYTHPDHPNAVRAPEAEALAAGGIETRSAQAHRESDAVSLPAHVADALREQGLVECVKG